jgi:hypothetical protein
MSWIWDTWKESLEEGKRKGKELKKKHKDKIKGLLKKEEEDD